LFHFKEEKMRIKARFAKLMSLCLLVICADCWACSAGNGEIQSDDGGLDQIDTPGDTADVDMIHEDVPGDDLAAHEDVQEDEGPGDVIDEEEGPSTIEWTITDLGISAVAYDIAHDNNGNVHIIWKHDDALHYGRIESGVLVGVEPVPDSARVSMLSTRPRLVAAPDGSTVHTCWVNNGYTPLRHAWRDSDGDWHTENVWDDGGSDERMAFPSIGVDASGAVHIITQRYILWSAGGTEDDCYIAYFRKQGESWAGPTEIWYDHTEWRMCSMFTDGEGGVHATWKSYPGKTGKYRYAPSGGSLVDEATLDIPVSPDPGSRGTSMGDSFVTDDGAVHHAFLTLGIYTIDYAIKPAGSGVFTLEGRPSIEGATVTSEYDPWPGIGVDGFGRVFVSWGEQHGTIPSDELRVDHVCISVLEDGTWEKTLIDDAADIDRSSKPAVTATGRGVYVVWRTGGGSLKLAMTEL